MVSLPWPLVVVSFGMVWKLSKNRLSAHFAGSIIRWPGKLVHQAAELVCPPACAACREEIADSSEVVCDFCQHDIQQSFLQGRACPVCGVKTGQYTIVDGRCNKCQNTRPAISAIVGVGEYDGALRQLILAFKFGKQSYLDRYLGSMLAPVIIASASLADVDCLMPIPLHWRRRWLRTYNQSNLLARATSRILSDQSFIRRTVSTDLVRIRNTRPQTTLPVMDRKRNLAGAFAVRSGSKLAGKHICLIDDVTTTGTTLRVAGRTLLKAGASRVSAAVLAVAGQ